MTEAKQRKYEITYEKVARDLQMIRDAAVEDGSYSAAVQAEMGRAKLAGLMVDKKEIKTGKIDQMDRGEVEARLRSLIDKHGLDFNSKQEDLEPADLEEDGEVMDVDFEEVEEDEDEFEDANYDEWIDGREDEEEGS